jgi:hypothetical protein
MCVLYTQFQHLTDVFAVYQNQEEVWRLLQEVGGYFHKLHPSSITFGFQLHHLTILLHSALWRLCVSVLSNCWMPRTVGYISPY